MRRQEFIELVRNNQRLEAVKYVHVLLEHCIVLYCIVLYCIVLYCIVLYCIVLVPYAFSQ